MKEKNKITLDGNTAVSYVAYAFTEVAAVYPITPSSSMADQVDKFSFLGRKNIFGSEVKLVEMQSEAGAAGAIHGALSAGALATTFTSSQGLLLMIPNMYKIAGELLPSVIHVAARSIATHALSIFGDHSDIYACRQTGYAMICSNSPQESAHMAALAHLSTVSSRIPFIHFFDGFRTSHEIQKISLPDHQDFKEIFDWKALKEFRSRALNPEHPIIRGTAQNDDVYFQNREASNIYYNKSIQIIEKYMKNINEKYNTQYKFFEYYGSKNAEKVIIAMGSVCETIEEVIDYLIGKGEKVGLIKVRVYRPFSQKHLLEALPISTKKISVLDRTKEPGSIGEPLYLDVLAALKSHLSRGIEIYSGRYGLSSKNTTPGQIISVYKNMDSNNPKSIFTIGINDDVTHLSLEVKNNVNTIPKNTYSCKFWGIGSDGTIGAAKNSIKIIGDNTDLNVQGFFSYDSKKSGGTTIAHLRFGLNTIKSTYYIDKADFVACHAPSYIFKYDILKDLKPGGCFLLNSSLNEKNLKEILPNRIKKFLAEKSINFYILDATEISRNLGLGGRINTALQAAFFKIIKIFEPDKAFSLIKSAILSSYGKKGEKVVEINNRCAEEGMKRVKKISIPESWKNLPIENEGHDFKYKNDKIKNYVENIALPISKIKGNELPVSAFLPYVDGSVPLGSAAYEKRETANLVPKWKPENCIECNLCSYVCPHAVIRPSVLSENDISSAPKFLKYKKMIGIPNLYFSVNISVKDCTGCGNCAEICPGIKNIKALEMKEFSEEIESQKLFDYNQSLTGYPEVNLKFKETTVKGSQFKKPLLEFSGACAGCGETPYAKLATQLFGDQMIIANATGCSSIWGASFPSMPYTTTFQGNGPAWHNSLFEDNAEFGYGIAIAKKYLRNQLVNEIKKVSEITKLEELKSYCEEYLNSINSLKENKKASLNLIKYLETCDNLDIPSDTLKNILENKDSLSKKSIWIFGGDGWAYDIGFGGLDHVIASGENVNILIFDTEVYSNTGGQASKSTPEGSVAQFAISGKRTPKKDLAAMAMSYGYVYTASVSLGADYNQCIKAFIEAESYDGPSIIIAYCPCINHGIEGGMKNSLLSAKNAVKSGYWNLFRFDPRNLKERKDALKLDNLNHEVSIEEFLTSQARYKIFKNLFPEKFKDLTEKYIKHSKE